MITCISWHGQPRLGPCPSNTALTVGPKIEYVVVATYNQYTFEPIHVILAKNLVGKQFSGKYVQTEDVEELKSFF